jgi:hypothetical protein
VDLIYKVSENTWDGKPVLVQMERHGQPDDLFVLRFAAVWAVSYNAARAIQRQYRQEFK